MTEPAQAFPVDESDGRPRLAPNGKPYESVWGFPRPPRLERVAWRVRVVHRGVTIVDAPEAMRVLETSQAPSYYVSPEYVAAQHLRANPAQSWCEWKGVASYADVVVGSGPEALAVAKAAWTYPEPTEPFAAIAGLWAFYAQKLDECWVDDERVVPNEGSFYGGWVTANVTGPIKGGPGTQLW